MSTIALPRPNTNGGLWRAIVALFALMYLLLLLSPQVAVREKRVECREQPIYLTTESGVPLTSDRGRYLIADNTTTCR
jgi:hypothetical protein